MATGAAANMHDLKLEVPEFKNQEKKRRLGKFQPFRRLFRKKKKRDVDARFHGAELKISVCPGEACHGVVSDEEDANQNLRDLNPIGSRSLSHDSVFIPEESVKQPPLEYTMSQENVSDKVRNLQKQIAQSIKFGQKPPSVRRSEGDDGSSDEDEVPQSPMKVMAQVEAELAQTEQVHEAPVSRAQSTPVKSPRSKRVLPPTGTIESINLDAVPQSVPRLDNAAAKHKLSIKPKNQRVSRKHRRFTQDLQEVPTPSVLQEELEEAGVSSAVLRRASVEEGELKKQRWEEEERLEVERKQALEEQQRHQLEKERQRLLEEQQRIQKEEEENRLREAAEKRRLEEEKRIREEEERRQCEELQRKEEEDRRMQEEQERLRKEKEERRVREEQERLRKEEEERRTREELERLRKEEEERRMQEEQERLRKEEEERRMREEQEHIRKEEEDKRIREEQERQRKEEERMMREQERQRKEEEEKKLLEEMKQKEEEEKKKQEEEQRRQQELEAERAKKQREEEDRKKKEAAVKKKMQEIEERKKKEAEEKKRKEEESKRLSSAEMDSDSDPQERKRRAEELRWREMEERQKPFSFKVSSGEKQILFQKVNLSPVTPSSSQQSGAVTDQRDIVKASSTEGPESPNLPTSQCVPHTAILVTGAQLCGTAVNMDQIKDPACKSLLGLGEDRKTQGMPLTTKSKTSPDRKSGKTKSLTEASVSSDSADVLAEWATIRSKIFKGVEEGKYDEQQDQNKNQPSSNTEEQSAFAHMNLRKTMSASPKFSITPAKKKFGDSNRNSEVFSVDDADEEPAASAPPATSRQAQNRTSKTVRITERGSEECMFAKDLPSFLVPNTSASEGTEMRTRGHSETEAMRREDEEGAEEKPSPFGIKLRRTNYSLRFHSEQSTEKRKKRYSAGDSFDGVPSPLTPIDPDADTSLVFSDKSRTPSPQKENVVSKYLHSTHVAAPTKPRKSSCDNGDKVPSKSSLYRRPATSPKPTGRVQTPPLSPLPKVLPGLPSEVHRLGGGDSPGHEQITVGEDLTAASQLHCSSQGHIQGEEEPKEKRSFFPSINIPWREKVDRKTELKREKPSLQSRHSLDSSKVQDKEAGPLWITLALQKQKGFREQQQNREERRSQREAKLAEKQARERDSVTSLSPTESRGSASPGSKPQTPEEPKRPDSFLGRFERRDQLKKANTLPSSVTVEISDSTPSPPAVKDVSKRFPTSDSPQVSTEPAWLALAKRKAKAWSDCPQIIK
ncbi:capping protein inhibiting regulator of actin dynamics isoform 1-T1 [Synchiropus picturatus]